MGKKKSHEQFVKEIKNINPNIEILGKYITTNEKIECKCLIHDYIWYPRPLHLLRGSKCPKCAGNYKRSKQEFIDELFVVNPNIELIGDYINIDVKTKFRCKIDGYEWITTPTSVLNDKKGCAKCAGIITKTHNEFIEEMKDIDSNIIIMSKYINAKTKVKCKCLIDGYEWEAKPNNLLTGYGCPICGGRVNLTLEDIKIKLNKINPNLLILSNTYINAKTKLKCRCLIDGTEWYTPWKHLSKGHGCPTCCESKGEKKINLCLNKNNINFIPQKEFNNLIGLGGGNLSYDFYLPNYNLLIEYQGEFHDGSGNYYTRSNLVRQQEHDKRKREYANKNNIKLLEIWYWDYDNVEEILNKELNINL